MTSENDAPAEMPGVEEIAALRFSPASLVVMRITPDGRLVPGEGLSEDEATRGMFSSLQQMFASKANEMEARALAAEAENRELRMQMLADEGQDREIRSLLVRAKDYIVYNADSLSMNSPATLLVEEIAAAIRAEE